MATSIEASSHQTINWTDDKVKYNYMYFQETGRQSQKRTYHSQGDAGGVTGNCNQVFQTPGRQPDRGNQERRTQLRQVLSAD